MTATPRRRIAVPEQRGVGGRRYLVRAAGTRLRVVSTWSMSP